MKGRLFMSSPYVQEVILEKINKPQLLTKSIKVWNT